MNFESALGIVLRVSLLLALSLAALPALRAASAAVRRWLLVLGLAASLLVPLLAASLPQRPMMHVASPAFFGHVVAEALSPQPALLPLRATHEVKLPTFATPKLSSFWVLIWAAGALLVCARAVRARVVAWRLSGAAQPKSGPIRISAQIDAPVVVGLLQPVVLLPLSSESWSAERRQAVLLHERSHVENHDGLALLLGELVCAVYWFHPLAWLTRHQLRRECELVADEAVIAAGLRPTSYAQHLLEIARGLVPAGGIAMAARPSELARRIQVLVSRDRLPTPLTRRRAALFGFVALSVLGVVACVDTAKKPAAEPASAPNSSTSTAGSAIDARLQAITNDEAKRVHAEWGAERVAIVVLDAHTGALLANSDDAPGKPIVPASTLKPLTVAIALDAGLITADQRFDCGNGARSYGSVTLRDAGEYGLLDTAEIIAVSSNVGVSRIFDLVGGERLGDGLRRFRVGAPANIPSNTMQGAIIANGEGSTTTPLALATAYSVLANDGVLMTPGRAQPERVIKPSTAKSVRAMLEGVVNGDRATGKAAAVAGARVGGKTGTSDDPDCASCAQGGGPFMNFVGIVPIESPRWVIFVGVGKPNKEGTGGTIAAPAFSRVATRALSP